MSYLTPEHKFARRMRRIHLIGIGGSGMSGIAEVLATLGFVVSGSDVQASAVTRRLESMQIRVHIGHDGALIKNADVVVYSSAIDKDNEEMAAAREGRLPLLTRAEMLAELMRFKIGIAVAGTHGKTTTTSLLSSVLAEAGLDPTFVIGGLLNAAGTNAALGQGQYLVAEADESDGSFQLLQPLMAVVTNIDADHMATFGNDFARLERAFSVFLHRLPFYGIAVLCADDEYLMRLAGDLSRHTITYGLSPAAQVRAESLRQSGRYMRFDLLVEDRLVARDVKLNLPGEHNVRNALAAIAVGVELEVDLQAMVHALAEFRGVGRRFNLYEDMRCADGAVTLVDDYAHHPTEIAAVIEAVRQGWPEQRLVLVFQPHRFSRTRDLFDEFADVLNEVDLLILTDVYAAGEALISGATAVDLSRSLRNRGKLDPVYVSQLDNVPAVLHDVLRDGDMVLMVGAGSIGALIQRIVEHGGVHTQAGDA